MKFIINRDVYGESAIRNKVIDADSFVPQQDGVFTKFKRGDKLVCFMRTDLIKTIDFED